MRDVDLKPLEDLFRSEVFKFLKKEGKIANELIGKLMKWKYSGFSVDNQVFLINVKETRCRRADQKRG